MGLIFTASTDLGTPAHTSRIIVPILKWLDPNISEATIDLVHHIIRKTAHFVGYAILGILIWRAIRAVTDLPSTRPAQPFRLALLCAALYASTDETHQIFVPGREPAVRDVLLDTCGAAAGLAVAWCVSRPRPAK